TRKAEKCSMCYERLDIGMNPACVNACPVGALSIIDLDVDPVPDNAVQYPPGFPHMPQLNPGTRFILARQPKQPEDK
ncbi:DMSO reductase, partial [Salmonella enterica]|nr:DMSO reductase [Salmonella enterica]